MGEGRARQTASVALITDRDKTLLRRPLQARAAVEIITDVRARLVLVVACVAVGVMAAPAAASTKRCGRVYVPSRGLRAKVRVDVGPDSCGAAKRLVAAAFKAEDTRPNPQFAHETGGTGAAYRSSKTALNALTVYYAQALAAEGFKVNALAPGLRATNLNARAAASGGDPAEAAAGAVRLALLPDDGPTGEFFSWDGTTCTLVKSATPRQAVPRPQHRVRHHAVN